MTSTHPCRDERGLSVSTLVALLIPMMLLVIGLAVDGSAHASAVARAQTAADEASRAGQDAGVRAQLDGRPGHQEARAAALQSLASAGVAGQVTTQGDRVQVQTRVQVSTTFLSIIGIITLTGRGQAEAEVVAS